MKKTLITLAAVAALSAATVTTALAGFGHHNDGQRGVAHVERMARMLDLTPEQKEKMKTVFAEQAQKRDQMRTAMQADMKTGMQTILTPEQYTKMADLREMRGAKGDRGDRRMKSGCDGKGQRAVQ